MTAHFHSRKQVLLWLIGILVIAVTLRLLLFAFYPPTTSSDTNAYRRISLAALGQYDFDGARMPGYPVFLAILGEDRNVYAVQLGLGVLTTLGFFWLGFKLTGSPALGGLAALGHTLNLSQLFFEASILTESLTAFLLAGYLVCVCFAIRNDSAWRVLLWLGAGLAATLAGMVRPLYFFLPFWTALAIFFFPPRRPPRFNWKAPLLLCLPAVILGGIWVNYVYTRFGDLSLTAVGGYHITQHTGAFYELVPDEEAAIRDTFLKYREKQFAEQGILHNAVWDAVPELMQVSGLNFYSLSDKLMQISVQLILKHPHLYLQSVFIGWVDYWKAAIPWKADNFAAPWMRNILNPLVLLEKYALPALNLIFLVVSLLLLFWRKLRQSVQPSYFAWLMTLTIWITSILQSLPEHGDNPRFLVPMQSWIILWLVWLGWSWWSSRSQTSSSLER